MKIDPNKRDLLYNTAPLLAAPRDATEKTYRLEEYLGTE